LKNPLLKGFLLLFVCATVNNISINAQNLALEEDEIIASFIGDYEVPRNSGTSSITLYLDTDSKLIGDYCLTLGDRADCGRNLLKNPSIINDTTIHVEWESGYWPNLTGTLKIRKINQNQIGIVMISTSHDEKFDISPISDFLYLNNAIGVNATGEMIFTHIK
jgi:hypothetical protein